MSLQSKTLLVPGYGTQITKQFVRSQLPTMRGFEVFADVENYELFTWGLENHLSLWSSLNPLSTLQQYTTEQELVYSNVLINRYIETLQQAQPEIIVAHSLGTVLTLEGLQKYLPPTLKKVIFVQSDLRITSQNKQVIIDLSNNIEFINVWCFWDQALISSMIINRSLPLGLSSTPLMNNYFVPLYKTLNLHESSLSDKRLLKIVYAD